MSEFSNPLEFEVVSVTLSLSDNNVERVKKEIKKKIEEKKNDNIDNMNKSGNIKL